MPLEGKLKPGPGTCAFARLNLQALKKRTEGLLASRLCPTGFAAAALLTRGGRGGQGVASSLPPSTPLSAQTQQTLRKAGRDACRMLFVGAAGGRRLRAGRPKRRNRSSTLPPAPVPRLFPRLLRALGDDPSLQGQHYKEHSEHSSPVGGVLVAPQ